MMTDVYETPVPEHVPTHDDGAGAAVDADLSLPLRGSERSGEIAASGQRTACGRFAPHNTAALKHGLRSKRVLEGQLPEQAEAAAALQEREQAIVADLGGHDALSALAVGQVRQHGRLELVSEYLWNNLQQLGPLTAKGKTRAALSAWLQVQDRLHRSATALGLERRPKPAQTVADYLATEVQA